MVGSLPGFPYQMQGCDPLSVRTSLTTCTKAADEACMTPRFKQLLRTVGRAAKGVGSRALHANSLAKRFLRNGSRESVRGEPDAASAHPPWHFQPPGHFYSPIVNVAEIAAEFRRRAAQPAPSTLPEIEINLDSHRQLWQRLLPFLQEIPFPENKTDGFRYYFNNPNFAHGDGSMLYAMLRLHRPRRLIEIGSGYSSACSIDTIDRYLEGAVAVTFIEPYPELLRETLGADTIGNVTLYETGLQEVPLTVFDALKAEDVLFIDSTHVMKTGSDVCHLFFEVLQRLSSNTLIHFHDMFWPFEYPEDWVLRENRSWNEIYAMRTFLMYNRSFEIVFFNDYFAKYANELIRNSYPRFLMNPGGSLWLRKL